MPKITRFFKIVVLSKDKKIEGGLQKLNKENYYLAISYCKYNNKINNNTRYFIEIKKLGLIK